MAAALALTMRWRRLDSAAFQAKNRASHANTLSNAYATGVELVG